MKLPIFLLAVACLLPTCAHAQSFDISMGMGSGYARAEYQGKYNHVIMPIMIGGVARLGRIAVSCDEDDGEAEDHLLHPDHLGRARGGPHGRVIIMILPLTVAGTGQTANLRNQHIVEPRRVLFLIRLNCRISV